MIAVSSTILLLYLWINSTCEELKICYDTSMSSFCFCFVVIYQALLNYQSKHNSVNKISIIVSKSIVQPPSCYSWRMKKNSSYNIKRVFLFFFFKYPWVLGSFCMQLDYSCRKSPDPATCDYQDNSWDIKSWTHDEFDFL